MFAAFLSALFFALNATCASRSVRAFGATTANFGRLIIGTTVLAVFAHSTGNAFAGAGTPWFLLSGIIGLGCGDFGGYNALPLLGSRLTVLVTQCLAAPIAAFGEWIWLGTRLTTAQVSWGVVILAGVALALMPSKVNPPHVAVRPIGFLFALVAAAGQGLGALVSRRGILAAQAAHESARTLTFGLIVTYERLVAGLVFTALIFAASRWLARRRGSGENRTEPVNVPSHRRWWMLANGLIGPVLAVGCFQWALASTPSGIVLPIAATTPLLAIPIAYAIEGDRPSKRSILGGVFAVAGCIALTLSR
jgi:drug/metabolite transporter (DMT)-like permease